jgi:DNA-binding beta-propeller fold protein YncE
VAVGVVCGVAGCAAGSGRLNAATQVPVAAGGLTAQDPHVASLSSGLVRHYEYVFPDGAMYVYDIDHGHRLVQVIRLPGVKGVRGVAASPRTHMLYISYGAFGGPGTTGRLMAYNLLAGSVVYNRSYSRGIDSMAIDPAGARIYMPDGELSRDGVWSVIAARSGNVIGSINGGMSPHETVVGLSGKRVYLGGRNWPYLEVASTATDRVFRRIGPLKSGVRPFTITFGPRFPLNRATFPFSAPSHGISLTPNERQLWVLDAPNGYLHVFDVSRVPLRRPRRIADIRLPHSLTGDGWIQVSRSGCYVYVGDSGDVLSTRSFRPVAFLPALRSTKESLEIDWRDGIPVATSTRTGLGYVTRGPDPSPPKCT